MRKIALVSLTPPQPEDQGHNKLAFPSYGIQRIAAAVAQVDGVAYRLFDSETTNADQVVADVEAYDPDVIGISTFVWSLDVLVRVARDLKRKNPNRRIILGGPSARVSMLQVRGYTDAVNFVDVLVTTEGERIIQRLLALDEWSPETLGVIPGLAYPKDGRWTSSRLPLEPLELGTVPSPYELGIPKAGAPGYLETYRGCPLHCLFCEWGFGDSDTRTFPGDRVRSEMQLLKDLGTPVVFNVDPGVNLNAKAFRNLIAAEDEVGLFAQTGHIAEIYPSHMNPQALELLERSAHTYVGIGLQSFDPHVLKLHKRKQDPERLERVVREVSAVGSNVLVDVQVILGLPGDTPETFRQTMARALKLPAQIRVYHCLVLPDALLDRSPSNFALDFDPVTMRMRSCLGWSERDFAETREWLAQLCEERGGEAGPWWWTLPGAPRVFREHVSERPSAVHG